VRFERSAVLALVAPVLGACTTPNDVVAIQRDGGGTAGTQAAAGAAGGGTSGGGGGAPSVLELRGDLSTHDSTVLPAEGRYYLLHSGPGIPIKTSSDLLSWQNAGRVFETLPSWILERLPNVTDLWAPDLSWFEGAYHLYYAASTFGSGRSCIGHATKLELGSGEAWTDLGAVICSDLEGSDDDWDAIDPATLSALDGSRWMVFGSFGSGIKLIRIGPGGTREGEEFHALAARPIERAVQAPFLVERPPYYYLFVSFDRCCQGTSSTYNIRVGRSENLTGPYSDRNGVPMLEGGGTLLLAGDERWRGVGANTIMTTEQRSYNIYHAYDANAAGRATLRIAELVWDEQGWPISAGP
jgi:arabinan endo-1,5-alpha-L-arabinosidase